MSKEILRVQNISKRYKNSKSSVFNNLNLIIYDKDFICISGESGVGKSTLIRILGLLDTSFSGHILYNQKTINVNEISSIDLYRKNIVGYVFQDFNLIDRYSVYRNLELVLIVSRTPYKDRTRLIKDVLTKVKLPFYLLNRKPQQLSGGQRQRVAIARTLLSNPVVLIADEPTSSLDIENAGAIIQLFKELNITLIVASHDPRIMRMATRHIIMEKGVLIES